MPVLPLPNAASLPTWSLISLVDGELTKLGGDIIDPLADVLLLVLVGLDRFRLAGRSGAALMLPDSRLTSASSAFSMLDVADRLQRLADAAA